MEEAAHSTALNVDKWSVAHAALQLKVIHRVRQAAVAVTSAANWTAVMVAQQQLLLLLVGTARQPLFSVILP